jgi:pimeloyl-ACP methyl ester carboxylesterase
MIHNNEAADYTIPVNEIQLHYLEYNGPGETLICLHGLTANAHAFDGLVAEGLSDDYRLVAPDLRGRGLSDHPSSGYSMEEHAQDILGLLDHLKIDKATLMGHSFGGLLSFYLAANYPARVSKLVILDAAAQMNPNAPEMLGPTLSRLDKYYPSWEAYIGEIKGAPFMTPWNDDMLSYYQADVMPTENGGVTPRASLYNIIQASLGVRDTPWEVYISQITQPCILINAVEAYTMDEPLLPDYKAKETAEMMLDCKYIAVDANHHTMLYGDSAKQVIKAVRNFQDKLNNMKPDYWNVSEEQVIEKTGKGITDWTTILDAYKAGEKKSNDVVAHLQSEYDVPRYWARTLATLYLKGK